MIDPMLEKVRKLLAKAEDPGCTPEEAEALNDKASELIAKYGMDAALLANAGQMRDEVGDRIVVIHAPYLRDKADLMWAICRPLRMRAIRKNHISAPRTRDMHLFGFTADLDRAELLFTSLLTQASLGLATVEPPTHKVRRMNYDTWEWEEHTEKESTASYRKSWLAGFTNAVEARLWKAENRAQGEAEAVRPASSSTSVALVLVDRKQRVEAAMAVAYPKGKLNTVSARRLGGSGYGDGREAGERADLGGTRVGGKAAGRIGQ